MSKSKAYPNQHLKMLYLSKIFIEQTDEEHQITTTELTKMLAHYGVSAERKALYRDINDLIEFGMDIIITKSNKNSYYLGSREFELPELKLLADAVCSAKFLTEKKSNQLLEKIESLAGVHQGSLIGRQIYVADRVKSINEQIYINVDAIHNAIDQKKQISFRYFDYGIDKRPVYREGTRVASPYSLIWCDEKYYLVAYYLKYPDDLTNFRVDRMSDIKILDDDILVSPEKFNVSEYMNSTFSMFSGDVINAELKFHKSLINPVLDRFGMGAAIKRLDEENFVVKAPIKATGPFFGWLFQFGSKASIHKPTELKEQYKYMLKSVFENENTEE